MPVRYTLIEYGEPTSLIPPDAIRAHETALLPTGRYAIVGNSDIHIVTMSLLRDGQVAEGRDWQRPTMDERQCPSRMHFGIRCLHSVALKQLDSIMASRIVVHQNGQTLVGVPDANYTVLRPGKPNVKICEWSIDRFYDPDSASPESARLLHLPSHVDELKDWRFQLQCDTEIPTEAADPTF